jgi:hypothetical protein
MADPERAFNQDMESVTHTVTLTHPRYDYQSFLLTDARDFHWVIILLQVPKKQLKVSVDDQEHEPLAFFKWISQGNSTSFTEKESFPIMKSVDKLRHALLSEKHFILFTDYRNLVLRRSKSQT